MINYNVVNSPGQGVTWFKQGWQLFKKQPFTWAVMALIVTIASAIGATSTMGQFVVSLISPVLIGGIALTMDKVARGETGQIEGLFSGFKHKPTLIQLLLIGAISMAVTALNTFAAQMPAIKGLSQVLALVWLLALVFAIPLVAIKQQFAVAALKSSLWVGVVHLFSIVPFVFMAAVLTMLAILPVGLGLLVLLPVLFCSNYCAFAMIYSNSAQAMESAPVVETTDAQEQEKKKEQTMSLAAPAQNIPAAVNPLEHMAKMLISHHAIGQRAAAGPSLEVDLPKGLAINHFDDYIHISRRWLTLRSIFTAVMVLFSGLLPVFLFTSDSATTQTNIPEWVEALLPWLAGLYVLFGLYNLATELLNRTNIFVSANTIEIKHQPLPWFGNKRLQATDIKQLFVRQRISRGENQTNISYGIEIIPHTGSNSTLLRGLKSNQQALFIEQEIERFLQIENMHVPGSFF